MKEKPLLIGRLAKLSGVKTDTIRFMSGAGSSEASTAGQWLPHLRRRRAQQVRFIRKAQALGFSLDEIQRSHEFAGSGEISVA